MMKTLSVTFYSGSALSSVIYSQNGTVNLPASLAIQVRL